MSRMISLTLGLLLTLLGGFLLAYNMLDTVFNLSMPGLWRLWPAAIVGVALAFLLPPVIAPQHRGLGALFVCGFPILAVGGVAFSTVLARSLQAWGTLWPLIVLAVALGLTLAALYMRVVWLLIPAFIIGTIGGVLQFCVLTGWWSTWSVLWTAAPLALGLALLVIGLARSSKAIFIAGLVVCGSALSAAMGMIIILTGRWTLVSLAGGLVLIAAGGSIIAWNVLRASAPPARPVSLT
jgi:hypothetical protein